MNLLVTGAWPEGKRYLEELSALGNEVCFLQYEKDPLPCAYDWVEGVICNGLFLFHSIEKFSNLQYIQLTSAGYDRVPMEEVRARNISIYNARGVYSIPMAEYALSGVLALYKKVHFFARNQADHRWEKHRNLQELNAKNVLIVGAGNVGQECAKRFSCMGCTVFGIDIVLNNKDFFEKISLMEDLDPLLGIADIVVLTLPLTEKTRYLFNKDKFSKMKQGALLINIARGAIVNTDDLIDALKQNLGGAVIDVFETEPFDENSPLWDMENVILTPHNSFVGEGNNKRMFEVIVHNLRNFKRS